MLRLCECLVLGVRVLWRRMNERFSAGRKGSRRVVGYLRSHVDGFDEQREC